MAQEKAAEQRLIVGMHGHMAGMEELQAPQWSTGRASKRRKENTKP